MTENRNIISLTFYSKPDCSLCAPFAKTIENVIQSKHFRELVTMTYVNIENDTEAFERYHEKIPVLEINGRLAFKYRVTQAELEKYLVRALAEKKG
jgi:hypothetical protein